MNREQYIKSLILEKGMTIKSFAMSINMPYSTLLSMLNSSIGGAAIDNVMKICKGLEITINDLQNCEEFGSETQDIILTEHEKNLILSYRSNVNMQSAIDKLLGIEEDPTIVEDMKDTIKQVAKVFSKDAVLK